MPVVLSRAGFTLVDERSAKLMERYGLTASDVFVHTETLKDRIARKLVPTPVVQSMENAAAAIAHRVEEVKADLLRFDPTLAAALEKSEAKIAYQMAKMRRKTEKEALRRDAQAAAGAQHLSSMLYPHRHLQERFYSILPFLAQHGLPLADRLTDAIELDCPDHRVFAV
jgi:bacillithiol synthase